MHRWDPPPPQRVWPWRVSPFSRFFTFLEVRVIRMRWLVAPLSTPAFMAEGLKGAGAETSVDVICSREPFWHLCLVAVMVDLDEDHFSA